MTREELLERLKAEQDPGRRQAILDEAMESLSSDELQAFVRDAGDELTPQQRDRVRSFVESGTGPVTQQIEDDAEQASFVEADDERIRVESLFDAATDPASDGGEEVTSTEAELLESEGIDARRDSSPSWVLNQAGGWLTDEQKQRLVEYVNFFQGGNFGNYDQLVESGYLDDETALNKQTVTSALLDDEPFQTLSISLPGQDMFTVRADEWESAQNMYGVDSRGLTRVVRATNQVGAVDSTGKPAWQLMAALMNATGMLSSITDPADPVRRRSSNDTSRSPFDIGGLARDAVGLPRRPDPQGDSGARRPGEITRRREDAVGQPITDEQPVGFDEAGVPVSRFAQPRTAAELSYAINEGMRLYDDSLAMSYIHVLDPQLAAKIKMGARNPGMVTRADLNKLFDLVSLSGAPTTEDFRTQLILQGEARLQGDSNDLISGYLDMLLGGSEGGDGGSGGSGGGQVIRQKPDPASLDERLRELYQTMFFEEPDEATLAKFRSQINAAVDGAQPGETVDWGARASQFARQDPRYADLYGSKPDTMSEDDYRFQFEQGQADMLGAERAGNAAAMAGMRDGNYQTTIGAAAGTKEAWDNSTFLGRLARAAQAVGEMT